jgi:hypothetical protein
MSEWDYDPARGWRTWASQTGKTNPGGADRAPPGFKDDR